MVDFGQLGFCGEAVQIEVAVREMASTVFTMFSRKALSLALVR